MGLIEARAYRRLEENREMAAWIAQAFHDPKKIDKVKPPKQRPVEDEGPINFVSQEWWNTAAETG